MILKKSFLKLRIFVTSFSRFFIRRISLLLSSKHSQSSLFNFFPYLPRCLPSFCSAPFPFLPLFSSPYNHVSDQISRVLVIWFMRLHSVKPMPVASAISACVSVIANASGHWFPRYLSECLCVWQEPCTPSPSSVSPCDRQSAFPVRNSFLSSHV